MSKLYFNKKTNTAVLSGKISSISEDRTNAVIDYQEWNFKEKKSTQKNINIITQTPISEAFKVGDNITSVGYLMGENFSPISFTKENCTFENEKLSVVSGTVANARLNEEKDQDGNPKLKMDGTARKPHFDIEVICDEDGKDVHHFIRVYNVKQAQNEKSNIEKMKNRFKDFENAETTPMRVTIATQPGQEFAFNKDDGTVYYGKSHLGVNSIDLLPLFSKQKTQSVSQETPQQPAPATPPTQVASSVPTPPTPQQAEQVAESYASIPESLGLDGYDDIDMEMNFE